MTMDLSIRQFLLLFTSPPCYDEYFIKYNFFDGECLKTSLSKTLGALIILGSVTVKVPQILKIVQTKSVVGINLLGVLLDLFTITSSFAYAYVKKFPFSAWGEIFFLAIQTAAIATLILHHTKRDFLAFTFLICYLAFVYIFVMEVIPVSILTSLQILNIPIVIAGKGLQALSNYKNKSTGQLSMITCWMQFAGTTVRIFTSIRETGDASFIISYVVCSLLNGIVAFQFLIYRGGTKDDSKKKKKK